MSWLGTLAPAAVVVMVGCADEVTFTPLSPDAAADAVVDAGPQCAPLTAPPHGTVAVTNEGNYPSTATYACGPSLGLSGGSARVCQADGSWSGIEPICLSSAGGDRWRFTRRVAISGSSGGAQAGYAVLIEVDTAQAIGSGKMQATAADLRFASNRGEELPYWVEGGLGTNATRIWVRIDSIPTTGTSISFFYGNPAALGSGSFVNSGRDTFELFDDFGGVTVDAARWSTGTRYGLPAMQTGALRFAAVGTGLQAQEVQTANMFQGSHIADFSMSMALAPDPSFRSQQFTANIGAPATLGSSPYARVISGWWSNGQRDCPAVNGEYTGSVIVDGSAATLTLRLGSVVCGTSAVTTSAPYVLNLTLEGGNGSGHVDLFDFRWRPYVAPEPTAGEPQAESGT